MSLDNDLRPARIGHILFLDMVGYSRESTSTQAQLLERLTQAVQSTPTFQNALAADTLLPIPTGDGMALLFSDDMVAPALCARQIQSALAGAVPVRMGIHSGLVQRQRDITGKENVVGEGINTAARVMGFGDSGHILLSAQYAHWLQEFDDWKPSLHFLGGATAKHDQRISLYSLHGEGFGNHAVPIGTHQSATHQSTGQNVVLVYRRSLPDDERVLRLLERQLTENGHQVFVDYHLAVGTEWAKTIEEKIRSADAVVAILSPDAIASEMLQLEIETTLEENERKSKPLLLPVWLGAEAMPESAITSLIQSRNYFHWLSDADNTRLVVELLSAIQEPLKPTREAIPLEPVGGAVPPTSPFYIARRADAEFLTALDHGESILLVRGARQMGKTSLLAQGGEYVRRKGWRLGITDFQNLSTAQLGSEPTFYKLLAATLARQLEFHYDFANEWEDFLGPNLNLEQFLRTVLEAQSEPVVWFMDEVDKLFLAEFSSDFFGQIRSWHNRRALQPHGPWSKLTVVISYATEANLFIKDLNQSPFNVGRRIELEDFTLTQLIDLNRRYRAPLRSANEVEQLQACIAGQPFLARRALDLLATGQYDLSTLLTKADRDDGPFGDHLKRLLVSLSRLPAVTAYLRSLLTGAAPDDEESYFRLLAAGVIRHTSSGEIVFRCTLYQRYLTQHLKP